MTDRDLDWWRDWRFYAGSVLSGFVMAILIKVLPG